MNDLSGLWIKGLTSDEIEFIKRFVLYSGSLKQMSTFYNISYPTIRLRLNQLIEKIKILDEKPSEFEAMMLNLVLKEEISYELANKIISMHRKEEV